MICPLIIAAVAFVVPSGATPGPRAVKFTDDVGYIRVNKGGDCWTECGGRPNWAGHCGYCGLSNEAPGFCCHSDGRGHCSDQMISAIGGKTGYHCVIPKTFDNVAQVQTRTLNVENCWSKCGRKRGWAGKCGACGPIGYCCHADGRGSCPGSFAASLKVQGHTRRNMCVVPASTISNMKNELAAGSACTDLAVTECRTLSSFHEQMPSGAMKALSPAFRNCRRFFQTSECASNTSGGPNEKPVCITRVTNKCETEPKPVKPKTETKSPIESQIKSDWNVYQREFFRYLAHTGTVAMGAVSQFMPNVDSSNGASGMVTSLSDALLGGGLSSNSAQVSASGDSGSFNVFALAVATLGELETAWGSESGNFNAVNLGINYDHFSDVTDILSHDFDSMVANSGASFATQSHVIIMYDELFKSVAPWSDGKSFIMDSLNSLDLMPWILHDMMAVVSQIENTDSYGEAVKSAVEAASDILSDEHLSELKGAIQSPAGVNMAKNAAMVMEVQKRLIAEGVTVTASTMDKAMNVARGSDPFNMDSSDWDEALVTKLAYISARMAGVTGAASEIAMNIKNDLSNMLNSARDSSGRLGALGGSKQVYKSLVTYFLDDQLPDISASIQDMFTDAIADMPELSMAGPAQELAEYFQGYALQHGTIEDIEEMRAITQSEAWYGIGGPLMSILVVDDATLASDAEVEGAFECGVACNFDTIDMDRGRPDPVTNCGDNACMLIQTGTDGQYGGNEEGSVGQITLKFEHFPDIVYPEEVLAFGESRTYCFPNQPLMSITVQSSMINAWMGTFTIVQSLDNPVPISLLQCTDCECADGPGTCPSQTSILVGIDGDDNVQNNMDSGDLEAICRNGNVCHMTNLNFNSSSNVDDGKLNGQVFDGMVYQTGIDCAACDTSQGDHLINAMAAWCDVNRVLGCEEKGWCLDSGCYCPEYSDADSRVNDTYESTIISMVVMEYFSSNTSAHGIEFTAEDLQCVAQSLAQLPVLSQNNTRDEIQDHIFSSLYENGIQGDKFDNIQKAITNPCFNYNAVFVIENMLATKAALEAAGDNVTDINDWDLGVIDWEVCGNDKLNDLTSEYQTSILEGLAGNPVQADVEAEFNGIWTEASGFTGCAQWQQIGHNHWNCPDAITAANPTVETCGQPEQVIENVCVMAGTEYWSWASGIMGAWSMQWWEDQLAKYDPALSGSEQAGMMAGFADAMGGMNDLWFWSAGNSVQSAGNGWFQNNMAGSAQAAAANEILYQNADQFGGLDWMLAGGDYWGSTFASNNGGSMWGMYNMMQAIRNDGEWSMFGQWGDGSYINATQYWFGEWINSQNWGWSNEQWLMEYMNTTTSYWSLFNATHDIVFWDTSGGGGSTGGGIIWTDSVEYPVNEDCLRTLINEDIIEYFTAVGKPVDTINQVSTALSENTQTFPCGDAQQYLIEYLTAYFTDVVGDVSLISDCLTADTLASLTVRMEFILGSAKLWEEDIGTEQEFKDINWDWVTFDLIQEDITDLFLETGLQGMEELQEIVDELINDNKLIDIIQEEIGNRAAGSTTVAGTTVAAATTGSVDILGMAQTTTAGNPYAPGQGMVAGDPHVKVKVFGQEAICFEISDVPDSIIDLLSDPETGLEVNGQVIQEGKNLRLERIFISTPRNIQIAVYPEKVTIGQAGTVETTFTFDENNDLGSGDVHVEVLSNNKGSRKNGVIVTLPGENFYETKFHISIKNGKNSMRFEILDSQGLAGEELTGLIGHSILPNDYSIDKDGTIHVGGQLIDGTVSWDQHEMCHHIKSDLVPLFLGHTVSAYRVVDQFDRLRPKATLEEVKTPK